MNWVDPWGLSASDGKKKEADNYASKQLLASVWSLALMEPSFMGEIAATAISTGIAVYSLHKFISKRRNETSTRSEFIVHQNNNSMYHYTPAPNSLPGIPDAKPVKRKTPVQGGGGLRKRWKDANGNIYEWDSQHGDLEKYNKNGQHQGSIDPDTGEQTKPPVKGRKVEP